ncbi:MAG TPA: alpha-xylosidase, partial [Tepidisphaeraceae bacterium]|nr:alpha-xylosidase [Tepidisphaeraceae bacterium]
MKFSDGAWLWAKGVNPHMMRKVSDYRIENDTLSVTLLDRLGDSGSDRFEGVVLQLRITSPLPDVLRVQIVHDSPAVHRPAGFDLDYSQKAAKVAIRDEADQLTFTSGRLTARIDKRAWNFQFIDQTTGEPITSAGSESLGYMDCEGQPPHLMQRLQLGVGENIYGFGEQFTPLIKNGQTVKVWNEDGGTISDQAYKTSPFYLSTRGYGLLVNTPAKVEFEVATERVQQIQFSVAGEGLDYYLFYGPDPKDVLGKYTALSGRAAAIPAWSFGLWLSTSFTTQYDEKTVNEFVDGMLNRGIPLSVFHFDCFWMKQRHWCNFLWDREKFPDPKGMIQRLKAKGLKVCVWINSYISGLSEIFEEGRANGYFIKKTDGSVFQRDQWQPAMAIVDFTNPAAVKWYQGKLRALLEMGVDCFKTDFGERIPSEGVVYSDGSDPKLMHNYYPFLYNKAVFELLESFHGKGNAIVFARSATAGCQRFPIHWGGDCEATFESMAEDLRGGLSFCSSGAAFWSHDIGGFTGKADPAVYKRWVALGLLSTHSRLHGSESYRVPWLFDEESVEVVRHFTLLKNRLFPYLYAAARQATEFGWPVMRSMFLEFPDDPTCQYLDRQYMLGPSLLVAPIFRRDGLARYYVPHGKWTDFFTGQLIEGGAWRSEKMDFLRLPLLVRENSVIPMTANEKQPAWTFGDSLVLNLYHITDGCDQKIAIPPSQGDGAATFRCRRQGTKITLESDGRAKQIRVLLRSMKHIGQISNGGPA